MPFIFNFVLLLIPVLIIGLSLLFSWFFEQRHLHSLDRREDALKDITLTDLKTPVNDAGISGAHLVSGQAVIGCDYFKSWLAGLRNLIGGEVHSLQTVLTRARREALVRMLDEARNMGANEVINVRFESSNILSGNPNRKRKGAMCAEIYAYGTAIVRQSHHA